MLERKILPFKRMEIPLVAPTRRFAIIGTLKDIVRGYLLGMDNRWTPAVKNNLLNYEWEAMLTGRLDLGETSPLNVLVTGVTNASEGLAIIEHPREVIYSYMSRAYNFYQPPDRNGGYEEVIKIFPGHEEVYSELMSAIERLEMIADRESLTFLLFRTHGEEGNLQVGSVDVPHRLMLHHLDRIPGKKAIMLFACHGGTLIEALQTHSKRCDYAIITTSNSDKQSENGCEHALDIEWSNYASRGYLLSEFPLRAFNTPNDAIWQQPQRKLYFDASLMDKVF